MVRWNWRLSDSVKVPERFLPSGRPFAIEESIPGAFVASSMVAAVPCPSTLQ